MHTPKKIFVVSDVHGHCTLLKQALDAAGFDKENEQHLLVCCGDYFDRGSENVEVLKFFERLERKVLIRGNHEDMLVKILQTGKMQRHNYLNGTLLTIQDFFGKHAVDPQDDTIDFSGKTRTVDRVFDFVDETVDFFETENYVFLHGWLPDTENWREADAALWERARWLKWVDKYEGVRPLPQKTLVCGHAATFYAKKFDASRAEDDASIFYGEGMIAIDARTIETNRVNVLVVEDRLL